MAFGDVLKANLYKLKRCSIKKNAPDTFWKVLRDIAVEEIKANYPFKVDSDTAISVYYDILSENENFIPRYYIEKYQCNGQERYRVGNRNVWSSNAFHPDGLAHQKGIIAYKEINENKKGSRIVYKGDSDYVN